MRQYSIIILVWILCNKTGHLHGNYMYMLSVLFFLNRIAVFCNYFVYSCHLLLKIIIVLIHVYAVCVKMCTRFENETENAKSFILINHECINGVSWLRGLVHWTQVLVLSECGSESRPGWSRRPWCP